MSLRRDHLVAALVIVSASQAAAAGSQYFTAPQHFRIQRNGNVWVAFNASHSEPVKSALARLH